MSTRLGNVPVFKNNLHSSQGKAERIDWIIGFVKQDPAFIFDKPYTSNVKIITEIIEDQCRLLRLSPNTRKDYCEQILFELKMY